MIDARRRVQCANEGGGREWFTLKVTSSGIRIDTPGALTRTRWTVRETLQLRSALDELLVRARGEVRQ